MSRRRPLQASWGPSRRSRTSTMRPRRSARRRRGGRSGSAGVRPETRPSSRHRVDEDLLGACPRAPRCAAAWTRCWRVVQHLEAPQLLVLGDVVGEAQRGGARARRVGEDEEAVEADLVHEGHRRLEVGLGLAGIADDDVARQRQVRDGGRAAARPSRGTRPRVYPRRMEARMRSEPDCTGRWRYGHRPRQVAEGLGHPRVHVLRVRGREAQAPQAGHRVHALEQVGEVDAVAAVRVDGLAEQHHLGIAARPRATRTSSHDVVGRPADLGPARPRHHAEAADVVAALHGGDVRAHGAGVRDRRVGTENESALRSRSTQPRAPARARRSSSGTRATLCVPTRTSTYGARSRIARALELGHAAAHADDAARASRPSACVRRPSGVEQLLRRLLAHRAGVDEDEVRVGGRRRRARSRRPAAGPRPSRSR